MSWPRKSWPRVRAIRSARSFTAGIFRIDLPDADTRILTPVCIRASRVTTSRQYPCSVASLLRNFRRTGTGSKMRLTKIEVPTGQPASESSFTSPDSMITRVPAADEARRVTISTREIEAMLGSASPRKPKERTR